MNPEQKSQSLARWSLAVALVALLLAVISLFRQPAPHTTVGKMPEKETPVAQQEGLLDRIEKRGELHAGYGVYPPYTQENPNTQAVTGFNVEIIEHIAKELKCEVVWHRFNWNTMSADLKRGEYDVIAEPIFQTIPRAREFAFTEPYAYFPDGIAVVRKAENRFKKFDDLDRSDIIITTGQGWASEMILKSQFTKPKIVPIQIATDLQQVFNEVLSGRADVAVTDGADAERFVREHSDQVKALWLDNPPAAVPAGFALRPSDTEGAKFLTVCLKYLKTTGVLDGLAKKYGITTIKSASP